MNLHEYQAKAILLEYGLPVSKGYVVTSVEEGLVAINKIGGSAWVLKAQIHAGGRGKSGGVQVAFSKEEVAKFIKNMVGKSLVTFQTNDTGQLVNKVLIEEYTKISRELYLSAIVDRISSKIIFMASTEGGVEIEEVAQYAPEKIFKEAIDPFIGAQLYQARNMAFKLGLKGLQIKEFIKIFMTLARIFQDKDLEIIEINPLVITNSNKLHCLDVKISVDTNALYRQPQLSECRDWSQEDKREARAAEYNLNYVALSGNIGCIVNGAGLAMATMDIIKLYGAKPANFLDVGGGVTKDRVSEALRIILSDSSIKGIFVNILGGIVRCDTIADGLIAAVQEINCTLPLVVHLAGTNSGIATEKLYRSNVINIITASSFSEGAKKIIELIN